LSQADRPHDAHGRGTRRALDGSRRQASELTRLIPVKRCTDTRRKGFPYYYTAVTAASRTHRPLLQFFMRLGASVSGFRNLDGTSVVLYST
jgi:hypothetical protein